MSNCICFSDSLKIAVNRPAKLTDFLQKGASETDTHLFGTLSVNQTKKSKIFQTKS